MARQLPKSGGVDFDFDAIGEPQINLIDTTAFFGMGQVEQQSEFMGGGSQELPKSHSCAKTTREAAQIIGDKNVNPLAEDEYLKEGFAGL
ncbi:MAG: hypothetical protein AAF318_12345 [Pseudomonadota bacterium]